MMTLQEYEKASNDDVVRVLNGLSYLSDLYDDYVTAETDHPRAPGIHASEVSGCLRRLVYSVNDAPREPVVAPLKKRIFKVGHSLHKMLQDDFHAMCGAKDSTFTFADEVKIAPDKQEVAAEYGIVSSCDGVFTLSSAAFNTRVVLEIKTIAPKAFESLRAPKEEHLEQAHVYMACLDIPFVWFLYFNKGNQNYTASTPNHFLLPFDKRIWQRLQKRFEMVNNFSFAGVLPEREESSECEICPFLPTCQPPSLNRTRRLCPS